MRQAPVLRKNAGVNTPRSGDKAVGSLVGFLVGSVGYAWFANGVLAPDTRWLYLPPAILALAVALTLPGTFFARDQRGVSILARIVAYFLLAAYVVTTVAGSSARWSLPVLLVASSCLAGASTLLIWPTLKPTVTLADTLFGVAVLLMGVAVLLGGVAVLRDGDTQLGVTLLLMGVAFLLGGVTALRGNRGVPLARWWGQLARRRPIDD